MAGQRILPKARVITHRTAGQRILAKALIFTHRTAGQRILAKALIFTHRAVGQRILAKVLLLAALVCGCSAIGASEIHFQVRFRKPTRPCASDVQREGIHHYAFFGLDRERIHDTAFVATRTFDGAQLKYTWRELEPERDSYDFSAIRADLTFLTSKGKRLFIQLQDVTFDPVTINVPLYLRQDPRYHGGANKQYSIVGDDERHAVAAGWVARRWDPAVQPRFHKLLVALGGEFDGKIDGINLPETAVDFGDTGRLFPPGFTPTVYRDAEITNMKALKLAFPKSVTMQYANFMPGEWLPMSDRSYLRTIYARARQLRVGVGGPDLLPYRKGQMNHSYPLLRSLHGIEPTGIAVQDGDYDCVNPRTGKPVTIAELVRFASEYLKVDYVFWCTQEPFYSHQLIPYLNRHSSS